MGSDFEEIFDGRGGRRPGGLDLLVSLLPEGCGEADLDILPYSHDVFAALDEARLLTDWSIQHISIPGDYRKMFRRPVELPPEMVESEAEELRLELRAIFETTEECEVYLTSMAGGRQVLVEAVFQDGQFTTMGDMARVFKAEDLLVERGLADPPVVWPDETAP